jgi:hypothetical protein
MIRRCQSVTFNRNGLVDVPFEHSEQIRECYLKAEDCAQKVSAETDPQLERDSLDSEQQWLRFSKEIGNIRPAFARIRTAPRGPPAQALQTPSEQA